MKIEKDAVTFEMPDADFVAKFGMQAAADMVLDFHCFHPQLPFLYDSRQLAAFLSTSRQKLLYYARHTAAAYHPVTIPKRNGDVRILSVPDDTLRRWQRKICRDLLAYLPVAPQATAYRKGGTLSGNAAPHVGKRYLLKLDISDFFGSICFEQVHSTAFHTRYFSRQVGFLLTSLCCKDGVLPQGAPTSPALSNLVMRNFDTNMARWCQRRAIVYTRYCDDLTFSADRPLFAVYSKAKNMLAEMGFDLNEAKTHFITNAGRQSVTGLTVNEKVSVPAGYKRSLRQEVYYALALVWRTVSCGAATQRFAQTTFPIRSAIGSSYWDESSMCCRSSRKTAGSARQNKSCCPAMTSRRSDAYSLITAWSFLRRCNRLTYILRLVTNAKQRVNYRLIFTYIRV